VALLSISRLPPGQFDCGRWPNVIQITRGGVCGAGEKGEQNPGFRPKKGLFAYKNERNRTTILGSFC
jgi:hypothetical protein